MKLTEDRFWIIVRDVEILEWRNVLDCSPRSPVGCKIIANAINKYGAITVFEEVKINSTINVEPVQPY